MTFFTYILRCSDGTYYVGHTDNLDARMAQHSDGAGCRYTAKRRPLTLLWTADGQTRDAAFGMERQLKGWSRAKKEALMRGEFDALPGLARGRSRSLLMDSSVPTPSSTSGPAPSAHPEPDVGLEPEEFA